jgi:hypothetical protein
MSRRPYDIELGDGPITQRRIDRLVATSDGFESVPQRTSDCPPIRIPKPPAPREAHVDPSDRESAPDTTYEATGFGD